MRSMTGQQWVVNHYITVTQTMGYDGDGEKLQETLGGPSLGSLAAMRLEE